MIQIGIKYFFANIQPQVSCGYYDFIAKSPIVIYAMNV